MDIIYQLTCDLILWMAKLGIAQDLWVMGSHYIIINSRLARLKMDKTK
jgi:hypothetical protein